MFHFRITISYFNLLLIDNRDAVVVDFVIAIKPKPVRENEIELDVVAITTFVSNGFNKEVYIFYFLYFLFDAQYLSLKLVINSLMFSIES